MTRPAWAILVQFLAGLAQIIAGGIMAAYAVPDAKVNYLLVGCGLVVAVGKYVDSFLSTAFGDYHREKAERAAESAGSGGQADA